MAGVPLQLSGTIPHQGRWWQVIKKLDLKGCIPVTYPQWSCCCDSVPWVAWQSFSLLSDGIYGLETSIPLPNACDPVDIQFHYTLPEVFTHPQWMLWWMSMGKVVASHWSTREVFLAWCWVITRPLSSCGSLAVTPLRSGLNWGGAATSVLCLADTPHTGNTSFWCTEERSVSV